MNFKQSCYIKKNTTELRNKLEEFGYKYGGSDIDKMHERCIIMLEGQIRCDILNKKYLN